MVKEHSRAIYVDSQAIKYRVPLDGKKAFLETRGLIKHCRVPGHSNIVGDEWLMNWLEVDLRLLIQRLMRVLNHQ